MLVWIDDMNRFVTAVKPVLDEWKQHTIRFVVAVEKRANMTSLAQLGSGEGNGGSLLHVKDIRESENAPSWLDAHC
jgi:hypothetical protein